MARTAGLVMLTERHERDDAMLFPNELREILGEQQVEVMRVNRYSNWSASCPSNEAIEPVESAQHERAKPGVRLEPQ